MALSGSVTTQGVTEYNRSVTLNWTATQDIGSNRSTISWSLVGSGGTSGWVEVGEIRITINGSQVYYRASSVHTRCYYGTELCSGTTTIDHNADGSKSFGITVEAGIYQYAINVSNSGSFALDTIPRACGIDSFGCSSGNVDGKFTVKFTPKAGSFYYKLRLSIPNIIAITTINIGNRGASQQTVEATFNSSQLDTICSKASSTVQIGAVIETYSDSGYTSKIGESSEPTLNLLLPVTTPTVSASSVAMNSAVTISMPRAASGLSHTLTYSFGSASGTIGSGLGTSKAWTVPLSLANQVPNATSGTCTITCTTYNGSATVGSKTVSLTLSVPTSVVPSISAITCTDPTGNLSTYGSYVQGKSTLKVVVSAAGSYSSTITSISITANGTTYTSNSPTTGVLNTSGTNTISVTVKDSRGRSASSTTTISVLAYSNPTISTLTLIRCNSSGTADENGAYMKAVFKATITALNNKNGKTITLQYKKKTDSSWTTAQTYSAYSVDTSKIIAADTEHSYDVKLSVADNFTTAIRQAEIGTVFTLIDLLADGKGIAFGKVAETTNQFDCDLPANLRKTLSVAGLLTASGGISGNVTGNVTGNCSGSSGSCTGNAATSSSAVKWSTARTLTIGNLGKSVNGTGNVSWPLADITGMKIAQLVGKKDIANGSNVLTLVVPAGTYLVIYSSGHDQSSYWTDGITDVNSGNYAVAKGTYIKYRTFTGGNYTLSMTNYTGVTAPYFNCAIIAFKFS